jgi:mannose/fructose-specific phosphotransferase system component IIA
MIGVVVVTHCRLAEELISAAELIVGRLKGFKAISIDSTNDPDTDRYVRGNPVDNQFFFFAGEPD